MSLYKSLKLFIRLIKQSGRRFNTTYTVAPFHGHLLPEDSMPSNLVSITQEDAIQLYSDMLMIRKMENALSNLYRSKLVRGFCHLYNGQEGIAAGICNNMRSIDTLISSYRAHAFGYLMSGRNAECVIGELAGVETGCSRGKGGSMHIYANNFYGGNGIVGSQVPLGTGLAFAHKYRGTNGVSMTLFGDGAANQGQVHESYNIAKLWKLPVVFIIENNLYGMGTHVSRSSANPNFYTDCAYIPGILVNGMDVLSVGAATKFAIEYIMDGNGPIILEMRTYRYVGHSMSDPGSSYRTRAEIDLIRKSHDPIKTFEERIADSLVPTQILEHIKVKAKQIMNGIVDKVKATKEVKLGNLVADIEKNNLEKEIRNTTVFHPLKHFNLEAPK